MTSCSPRSSRSPSSATASGRAVGAARIGDGRLKAEDPRRPALHAHRQPGRGARRDRRRPRQARAHAPPAPGRRRLGQDRGRAARRRLGDRERRAGRDHGADRAARPPARPHHRPARRRRRHPHRGAHRPRARPRARGHDRRPCLGRDRSRRRHPRHLPGRRRVPRPRAGGGRRAAPLRRPPALRPHLEGQGHRRPGDDRDADPAHPRPHLLRRHGRLAADREARRTAADRDPRPAPLPPRRGGGPRPRGRRPRRQGLLDLPAGRGIGGARRLRRRGPLQGAGEGARARSSASPTAR